MSGDYSRVRFDPKNDFSSVLMQQGRVQLDSDWNEFADLLDRRWRAETTDIIGRNTVPKETPEGFRIQIPGSDLTIGRGRMYVDGLLAENHGKAPLQFDAVLAEQNRTLAVPYDEQPYFPNIAVVAPQPAAGGPHLVYLDVWQREVSFLEDATLIENAVGVDTTTRTQTVWQVKILPNVGSSATCGSSLEAWNGLVAPSDARLSSAAVGVLTNTDPCLLPPSGGYRGLENRLYRVEIHDGGTSGTATFKWASDNAVMAANVTAITALDKLTVATLGRDSVMHFKIGDWVEITDDWLEFARQPGVNPLPPGVMAQIKSIDEANRIISLVSPIPANVFNVDAQGNTDRTRHTRVRRWNQSGQVRDTNGNLLIDLNAAGANGVIPVPPAGTSIVLEDGVQITFNTPAAGNYRIGDYWNFTARTADASVEELHEAPPYGVHHHFSRLALVTFPNSVTDCRTLWPAEAGGISRARSLTLRGQGAETNLIYSGRGPALVVDGSAGVTIEELTLATSAIEGDTQPAMFFTNSSSILLQRCTGIRLGDAATSSAVIGLAGALVDTNIRENSLRGQIAISNAAGKPAAPTGLAVEAVPLLTRSLEVSGNALFCSRSGIRFTGASIHLLDTRVTANSINDCSEGGIVALGLVPPGSSLDVHANDVRATGPGIIFGTGFTSVSGNSISGVGQKTSGDGIVLATGVDKSGLDQCQVIGNRIFAIGGIGISVEAVLKSAMIKNNFINGAAFGAIVMGERSSADFITVENNQISNIVPRAGSDQGPVIGIRLVDAERSEVTGNMISAIGLQAANNHCVGVQLFASSSVRVGGNEIVDIGPTQGNAQPSAGIEAIGTFDRLDVVENNVRRSTKSGQLDQAAWHAVSVSGAQTSPPGLTGVDALFGAKTNTNFLLFADRVLARQIGSETLSLHGNFFDAYGIAPAVRVALTGVCTFSDNRNMIAGYEQATVEIAADAAVLQGNYVQGTHAINTVLIKLPDPNHFTALGNITGHVIAVNNLPLATPWEPLNRHLS